MRGIPKTGATVLAMAAALAGIVVVIAAISGGEDRPPNEKLSPSGCPAADRVLGEVWGPDVIDSGSGCPDPK